MVSLELWGVILFRKIKNILKKNEDLVTLWHLIRQGYFKYFFSDQAIIKKRYRDRLRREVELENPVKYNDKLQWLKLNWYDPLAIKCADKYAVREFVKDRIGEKYLNELYGVYESVDEIDLDSLPDQFVLKGTHGSGFNIICKDKSKMDWKKEFKKMERWLKKNYFWRTREWVYRDIKPRIICEKYLEQPEYGELRDYKIFCFNGKPRLIQVDFNRFTNHKRNIYDLDWNFKDVQIVYSSDKNEAIKKPARLDKMLELAQKLSEGFPHVRVDFYYCKNRIIFGELTFFPGSGRKEIKPEDFEIQMGKWLELPSK